MLPTSPTSMDPKFMLMAYTGVFDASASMGAVTSRMKGDHHGRPHGAELTSSRGEDELDGAELGVSKAAAEGQPGEEAASECHARERKDREGQKDGRDGEL